MPISPALFAFQGNAALLTPTSCLHFWQEMFVPAGLCAATHQQVLCQVGRQVDTGLSPCTELAGLPTDRLCWVHGSDTDRYGQEVLPWRQDTEEFSSLVFCFKC